MRTFIVYMLSEKLEGDKQAPRAGRVGWGRVVGAAPTISNDRKLTSDQVIRGEHGCLA